MVVLQGGCTGNTHPIRDSKSDPLSGIRPIMGRAIKAVSDSIAIFNHHHPHAGQYRAVADFSRDVHHANLMWDRCAVDATETTH
jgi:hypothetical protein